MSDYDLWLKEQALNEPKKDCSKCSEEQQKICFDSEECAYDEQ